MLPAEPSSSVEKWKNNKELLTGAEIGGQQISFSFKVGLKKDKVTVDSTDLTFKSIKTIACTFINEQFPDHEIPRIGERLMVFRHEYSADNILQVSI